MRLYMGENTVVLDEIEQKESNWPQLDTGD